MADFTGICVCPGTVEGVLTWDWEAVTPNRTTIVALTDWTTESVLRCAGAGAILCMRGGITSHASIIVRELGVPALVAVLNLSEVPEGATVLVDASNEEIVLK